MNTREIVLRREIVELASRYVGAGAKVRTSEYLEILMGSVEPASARAAFLSYSACALTIRGLWRKLGAIHRVLERPYVTTQAMSDVQLIARDAGALRMPPDKSPNPADAVCVTSEFPTVLRDGTKTWNEHIFVVSEREEGGWLRVIEGGQWSPTLGNCILDGTYKWTIRDDGRVFANSKIVRWTVDAAKLFAWKIENAERAEVADLELRKRSDAAMFSFRTAELLGEHDEPEPGESKA